MMVRKDEYKTTEYFCPFLFPTIAKGVSLEDIPSCMKNECAMWVEWYDETYKTTCGACGLVHRVEQFR